MTTHTHRHLTDDDAYTCNHVNKSTKDIPIPTLQRNLMPYARTSKSTTRSVSVHPRSTNIYTYPGVPSPPTGDRDLPSHLFQREVRPLVPKLISPDFSVDLLVTPVAKLSPELRRKIPGNCRAKEEYFPFPDPAYVLLSRMSFAIAKTFLALLYPCCVGGCPSDQQLTPVITLL